MKNFIFLTLLSVSVESRSFQKIATRCVRRPDHERQVDCFCKSKSIYLSFCSPESGVLGNAQNLCKDPEECADMELIVRDLIETSESCVDEINDSRGINEKSEENISQKSDLVELSSATKREKNLAEIYSGSWIEYSLSFEWIQNSIARKSLENALLKLRRRQARAQLIQLSSTLMRKCFNPVVKFASLANLTSSLEIAENGKWLDVFEAIDYTKLSFEKTDNS
ncbi:unnamed protein product [Oikopleura dioica]|uniref:Uncharacterized protein n=1 Tax=Oikopleura dioica TaxID=34765 RepID=E4WW48_OIKDI|nr:unnamed protein product [Oikopleura dioica]